MEILKKKNLINPFFLLNDKNVVNNAFFLLYNFLFIYFIVLITNY